MWLPAATQRSSRPESGTGLGASLSKASSPLPGAALPMDHTATKASCRDGHAAVPWLTSSRRLAGDSWVDGGSTMIEVVGPREVVRVVALAGPVVVGAAVVADVADVVDVDVDAVVVEVPLVTVPAKVDDVVVAARASPTR